MDLVTVKEFRELETHTNDQLGALREGLVKISSTMDSVVANLEENNKAVKAIMSKDKLSWGVVISTLVAGVVIVQFLDRDKDRVRQNNSESIQQLQATVSAVRESKYSVVDAEYDKHELRGSIKEIEHRFEKAQEERVQSLIKQVEALQAKLDERP